mmetsp:Transcript_14382/g.56766  ORF Transcript_14382/g.56766 Transcript_14382/m.56766 type:complete len:407 (-) Transcript_14382:42-1262(-)
MRRRRFVHAPLHPVRLALPPGAAPGFEVQVRPQLAIVAGGTRVDAFEPHLTHGFVVRSSQAEEAYVQVRDGRGVHLPGGLELDHERAPERDLDGRAVEHRLGCEVAGHSHARAVVLELPARDRRVVTHLLGEKLDLPDPYPVRLAEDAVDGFLHAWQGERASGAPAGALLGSHGFHVDVELHDAEEPLHGANTRVAHGPPRVDVPLGPTDDREDIFCGLDRGEWRQERGRQLKPGYVLPHLERPHERLGLRGDVLGSGRRVVLQRRASPGLGDGTIHPLLARHTVLRRGQQLLHPVRVPPLAPSVPAELERYATLLHHARDLLLRAQLQEIGGRARAGPRGRRHALPGRPERIEAAVLEGIEAVEKVLWLVEQLDAVRRVAVRVPAAVHQGLPPAGAIPSVRLTAR